MLDYAGKGKKIIFFPLPVIWARRFPEMLHLSPLYNWVYDTTSKDSFVSIKKAEKQLGYKSKYSNQDSLIRNIKWNIENRNKFEGASGVSHRVPWKQGAIGLLKKVF